VSQRIEDLAVHIVTPETSRTTHYFYGSCGNIPRAKLDCRTDPRAQTRAFVQEAIPMIEAIDEQMQGADFWSLHPTLLGK